MEQKKIVPNEVSKFNNKKIVLFVSEPVSFDQGLSNLQNKFYRGYTEKDVIKIFIKNLNRFADKNIKIIVLAHPRDRHEKLKKLWNDLGGKRHGIIIKNTDPLNILPHINAVAGMASTLLHLSWLAGKSVISLQPNLKVKNLESIRYRKGVVYVKDPKKIDFQIQNWLSKIKKK